MFSPRVGIAPARHFLFSPHSQPWSCSQSAEPVKVGWAKSKLSDDRFVKFCGIGVMSADDVARSFSHVPRAQMQAQLVAAPEQLFGAAQV